MDYKQAGVDVEAGYKSVELIKGFVKGTYRKEVLGGLGGFGGLFSIEAAKGMEHPVLVSGTDGVGTKLKVAFLMDKHDTVGIDCVAMCANDIVCCGAEPLFFLDYIACDKNLPEKIAQIVKGVTDGCLMSGMSLIGGETAEMPGLYKGGEYDIAGFATGIVDKAKIIDGSSIKAGDTLIGVASSGLHSNGFSLVRKAFRISEQNINEHVQELGCRLGEELIKPTKIYVKPVLELIKRVKVKGISNITGGGFVENIPRMMPKGVNAKINLGSWEILPIFNLIENLGNVKMKDMYNTFNMGIGMVIAVDSSDAQATIDVFREFSDKAWIIGSVIEGEENGVCFA